MAYAASGTKAVTKRLDAAIEAMFAGNYENVLAQVSLAMEPVAKREFHLGGKKSLKEWVRVSVPVLGEVMTATQIAGIRMAYRHPEIKPASLDGTESIEDITYHAIRCGFAHEAGLPDTIEITKDQIGSTEGGKILLPEPLILGYLTALIVSPSCVGITLAKSYTLTRGKSTLDMKDYIGRRAQYLADAASRR